MVLIVESGVIVVPPLAVEIEAFIALIGVAIFVWCSVKTGLFEVGWVE